MTTRTITTTFNYSCGHSEVKLVIAPISPQVKKYPKTRILTAHFPCQQCKQQGSSINE